jgi:dolichol-phosphate mannosyltransferase
MQNIHVILPSYNEEANLPKLLAKFSQFADQVPYWKLTVFVVNDGSTDNTLKVATDFKAENYKLQVVDQQPNQGLAATMNSGFNEAIKNLRPDDIVVALDADDSHNPFLIERMVKKNNEGIDVVIASRFQFGSKIKGLTRFREFTGWAAGYIFRIFAPIDGVRDYTCGFRTYKVGTLNKVMQTWGNRFIEEKGFACMAEILLKFNASNALFDEVPMVLRYDFKLGESKMNVWSTVKRTLYLVFTKNRQIKREIDSKMQ